MKRLLYATAMFLALGPLAGANSDAIKAAETVTFAFLGLVDDLKYQETYQETSSQLREEVSQAEWIDNLTNYRGPLGSLKSRDAGSAEYHESLPDAADGEYVIFTFVSSFENRDSAYEIVAVSRESDSSWRIIGYYIE